MTLEQISIAMPALLILLLALGVPIAFATASTGLLIGYILFGNSTFFFVPFRMYDLMNNYVLIAVPLFLLMGYILEHGGVAHKMFRTIHIWSGRMRGGLAVGTIVAGMILAAMVGVIGAEIVALGLVALPQMLKHGYDRKLSFGVVCAGGSLGQMIPPSVVLIIYALMANVPVRDLFMAALLPSGVLVGLYIAYVLVRTRLNPSLAPLAPDEELDMSFREKLMLGKELILPFGVILVVLGSLYGGVATPTEASAIGVFGALVAAFMNRQLNARNVFLALKQTSLTIGILMWTFFGANAMISVYSRAGGVSYLSDVINGFGLEPMHLLVLIMLMLLLLGMLIDVIGILILTMPIFLPILAAANVDLIWFGILFSINMQMSYLTPPFGPAVFYLKAVTPPDTSLSELYSAVWPFVGLQMVALVLVLFFPQLALWLPGLGR